jgi:hypothetical protein
MSTLTLDISISLDGYATAAGVRDDEPMGVGGQRLHAWACGDDPEGNAILAESNGRVGGTIAGRRTYERSVAFWGPGRRASDRCLQPEHRPPAAPGRTGRRAALARQPDRPR